MTRTSVAEVPEPDPRRQAILARVAALLKQDWGRRVRPLRTFDKPSEPHKDEL